MKSVASCSAEDVITVAPWTSPPAGRNRTFRSLYDHHFRLVWATVRTGGVMPAHCEDVVQEVWLQVHRLVDRLRPDASARAWLVSIARRRVAHYHRTQRRRQRRETAFGDTADGDTVPHGGQVEARSTLDRVLHGMSEDQRLTFVLVHGYGLTGEEVASAVGDSVNTIYSRLRLARLHLRRAAAATRLEEHRVAHAALHHTQPPRRAQARLRVLIALKLGLPGLTTLLPGGAASLGALGTTALVGIVAVGLLQPPRAPSPAEPAPTPATVAPSAKPTPTPAQVAPAPEPALTAPEPALFAPTPTRVASRSAVIPPAHDRSEPRRSARPQPAPEPAASSLAEETRVLKQAKRALDRGEPAAALALLDEHARAFPQPVLEDVQVGVRVRALCALGRVAQARQHAERMAAAHGGSVVARGVEDVCAPQGEPHATP